MKKRKLLIAAGAIIILVVLILITGSMWVRNYIKSELNNIKAGNYVIKSREVNVNLLQRQIILTNVVAEDSLAGHKVSVSRFKAGGIHIFPLLFSDRAIVNRIQISNPEVMLIKAGSDEKGRTGADRVGHRESDIDFIRIKKLTVDKGTVTLKNEATNEPDTLLSLDAGLEINNLYINGEQQRLTFSSHSAEELEARLYSGSYNLPGDLYRLQFDTLEFNSRQRQLNLKNFHLSSRYSKYDIATQTGAETDWYDIKLKLLQIKDINLQVLLSDTAFVFRTATLEELNATVFRDKRPPFPDKPDTKLPVEMLHNLPFALHSDSILIKNSAVVYEELSEGSVESGRISFNQLYASIFNLGTINDSIKGQTALTARAMVMNEALLQAEFIFPNSKHSWQYKASGTMAPVKVSAFNPMLVPSGGVKVNEGRINRLEFEFTYDNNNSEGTLELEYENLDITIRDKEDGSQKTIKTFITETFVLNKDNQQENNSYQKGTISFERDKKRSIFNYWWKSLFSGIKDVLAF